MHCKLSQPKGPILRKVDLPRFQKIYIYFLLYMSYKLEPSFLRVYAKMKASYQSLSTENVDVCVLAWGRCWHRRLILHNPFISPVGKLNHDSWVCQVTLVTRIEQFVDDSHITVFNVMLPHLIYPLKVYLKQKTASLELLVFRKPRIVVGLCLQFPRKYMLRLYK